MTDLQDLRRVSGQAIDAQSRRAEPRVQSPGSDPGAAVSGPLPL
jgi:hypothetical protein